MKKTYPMAIVTAPGKIEFQERLLAEPGDHQVLIRVRAASICGSDLHIFKGRHPAAALPVAVGHELAGEVVRTGAAVTRVGEGDRVAVEPVIVCGRCHFCRRGEYHLCTEISFQYRRGQGGFTPYFIADENWVHRLPNGLPFEAGALLEPLSVAVHAVKKSSLQFGDSCAIFGAGAVGLMITAVIGQAGGGKIFVVDLQPHRLRQAEQLGAMTLNNQAEDVVERIRQETNQLGVDLAFEAVGIQPTLVQSLQVLRKGGTAVVVGIFEEQQVSLPANLFVQREISLTGSQGYCWDFQHALQLVEDGRVNLESFITHRLPLDSLQEAFDLLLDPENQAVKVVVTIDEN